MGEGGQFADGGAGNDVVNVFAYGGESTGIGGSGQDLIEFRNIAAPSVGSATLDGGGGNDTDPRRSQL